MVLSKKWLGVLWNGQLDFLPDLMAKLGQARSAFAEIAGLVETRVLPLPLGLGLFESKVDGVFMTGRWLHIMVP